MDQQIQQIDEQFQQFKKGLFKNITNQITINNNLLKQLFEEIYEQLNKYDVTYQKIDNLREYLFSLNQQTLENLKQYINDLKLKNTSQFLGKWKSIQQYIININEVQDKLIFEINEQKQPKLQQSIKEMKTIEIQLKDQQILDYLNSKNIYEIQLFLGNQIQIQIEQKEINVMKIYQNNKLIFGSQYGFITIHNLQDNILQQELTLNTNTQSIKSICFGKKLDKIITGHVSGEIVIWQENLEKEWKFIDKINGHQKCISNLIIQKNDENILFSGSYDSQIKIWKLFPNIECFQILDQHKDGIQSMNFNNNENQLLTCSTQQIIIYEKYQLIWEQKQLIDINVFQCCFIWDQRFACFERKQQKVLIYDYNIKNKRYQQVQQITINTSKDEEYYSLQYYENNGILGIKSGKYLNLLTLSNKLIYRKDQVIEYQHNKFQFILSNDCKQIIIYNEEQNRIEKNQIIFK